MKTTFREITEAEPGPIWAGLFRDYWPNYYRWWSREGVEPRPTYLTSLRAMERHMPELVPLYMQVSELAGGGDLAARFLSFYRPPPYLSGCSQAVWPGQAALLVRNYDYDPKAFDAVVLRTAWQGRRVIGSSDGLFGLLDGINDAGLAVSLTFGGRSVVGDGFGVPLILRYVLQTCETAAEAAKALARIPSHMSYNVTVIDRARRFHTVFLAPDREPLVSHAAVATNHQHRAELLGDARISTTVERERFLLQRLTLHADSKEQFVRAFLRPPLYSTAFGEGFGTIYTASLEPEQGMMTLHWPGSDWPLPLDGAGASARTVRYPEISPVGR